MGLCRVIGRSGLAAVGGGPAPGARWSRPSPWPALLMGLSVRESDWSARLEACFPMGLVWESPAGWCAAPDTSETTR